MSRIPALCLVLLVGCGSERTGIAEVHLERQSTVTSRVGQTRPVPGSPLSLRFREVWEDFRCPVDVMCVWAGDAAVQLMLGSDGVPPVTVTLYLNRQPVEVSYRGYRVSVLRLQPDLRSDQPMPRQEDYVATFLVIGP